MLNKTILNKVSKLATQHWELKKVGYRIIQTFSPSQNIQTTSFKPLKC